MSTDLDALCVNTIRTLSMDAVQAANSGHPGTPMAMAPVAYTLWQRFLRFDPDDPIWPNRDRFVLSMGHASMLLYSLLHLTGVKAVNPKYETLGELVGPARRHQALPPARQQVPGPSRVPLDLRRRDDDRPARARAWRPASAWRSPASGRPRTSTGPASSMFDYDVYALGGDGCMMEGISERGRLARRAPQARQPLLDLRQQPHHDRGQHGARVQRGRRHALHRLRLERHARRRRQRPRDARPAPSRRSRRRATGRR